MSETNNRREQLLAKYEAMTTEQLQQLLRLDSEAPEGEGTDTEELLCAMEVLSGRSKNGRTAQESWESFQRNYLPLDEEMPPLELSGKKKQKTQWWRPLAAVAAVLVLIVSAGVVAGALGGDDLWNAVAKWTTETFSFVGSENTELVQPTPTDELSYETFDQAILAATGVKNLVPTQFPEGTQLVDITIQENPGQVIYMAFYNNGTKEYVIRVQPYLGMDPEKVELSGNLQENYEVDGTEYYVFSNYDCFSVVWVKDSYECYLSGDLSLEEIKMMIDSIGKEET